MNCRLPPLNSLRAFEAAARHLSISAAAEELSVTHSAVSRHVRKLEGYLGADLFSRDHQRLALTPRGEAYARRLAMSFDHIRAATAENFDAKPNGGRLRIGVYPTLATHVLIPKLARFREKAPDISFEIVTSHMDQDPAKPDIDVAVRLGTGEWPGLASELLCHEELIPVASPKLLCGRMVREPRELGRHMLLHAARRANDWECWFKFAEVSDVDAHRGMRFENSGFVYQAALNALGVAMAQTVHVRTDLQLGALVPLFDLPLRTRRSYYLVYSQDRAKDRAVQSFVHWMKSEIDVSAALSEAR
jgi:LysR family glycine cleavage system transcriptional activator